MKFSIALSLLILAFVLTGCAGVAESIVDPDGYTQRSTAQSDAQRSQAEAQQAFAESQKALADSEAERSRSEARRAEAEAQAASAQADFATAATKAVKDAAAQNKGVLIFAIALIAGMAAWMIHNNTKIVVAVTQQQGTYRPQSVVQLPPPPQVQMLADQHDLTPHFNGRWILIDNDGTPRFQQKLLQ